MNTGLWGGELIANDFHCTCETQWDVAYTSSWSYKAELDGDGRHDDRFKSGYVDKRPETSVAASISLAVKEKYSAGAF